MFHGGNPDSTVKGIATTMMVTFDMLKRANAAGLNMVISHEDTWWNDRDETKDLTANALYKLKTEYIQKNDMIVWRNVCCEFGPARALYGMLINVGNRPCVQRKCETPRGRNSLDVIHTTPAQGSLDMDYRYAQRACLLVKLVNRRDNLAPARRRTGAIGIVGQMPFMHVN